MTVTPNGILHVEHVWSMAISLDIRGDTPPGTLSAVIDWLHEVDQLFSPYRQDSIISGFDRGEILDGDLPVVVAEVLKQCDWLRVQSRGVFDVRATGRLDPSGLVKGWAIERAAWLLDELGVTDYCLNAGGDVRTKGGPSPGSRWRIGVRHPTDAQRLADVLEGNLLSVATSGCYERGAHIIDPRSGLAVCGDVASVTVVGPDLGYADAFATIAFILGTTEGLAFVAAQPGYGGYAISTGGVTTWTSQYGRYRAPGEDAPGSRG